jgi:hypothetical protein
MLANNVFEVHDFSRMRLDGRIHYPIRGRARYYEQSQSACAGRSRKRSKRYS